ncbi:MULTISPECIES: site-specific DNA-methyltransferase [unclassified Bradyrhizobium]|uniref:site-specific DNA-methyltransferase n=1 Tax=unclassified Bradyrhizobium TaxID=2631580 RepID=UPI001BA63B43|nr:MULTISPECIES: site-specific DNA-methyltransferase [unclassified Bradyrhizobium]WLA52362.1 site-specific DNA-methyltransferase [Bradyrhizobium elkanii]MBR1206972.1 site-specific DNA-methyltransferase [Bradyrhizobium sp. AUGA SZCCT0124]MBR1313511.1 site-specific DNA-methyltransferase [Bradyrhizobium sp. AUGA SZCCT0051]MBR1343392.1 site-specific DNA-methyltransferase [Bradyrhizobium sp. AUGA SZCCT0105]MBR1357188.1 site-specific DNA-methyltransferase [Bradyrhizobium sp. AUGA SZCCT0045]
MATSTDKKPRRKKGAELAAPAVVHEPVGPRAEVRVREETWPIDRIKPYARNAKKHDQAQIDAIRASLRQFGQVHRVLVDAEDEQLIAGHGRWEALKQEQFAEVRVLVAIGWSETEKRKFRLADNQLTMSTGWDEKLLKGEVLELGALGVELDQLGFEPGRIAGLLHEPSAGLTDPDEAPEPPPVPTSVRGDVWLLGGRHRITCGDSTNPEDVTRVLAGRRPHLMVTDPPYGVKYDPAWRVRAGHGSEGQALGQVLNDDRADWREAWELFPGDVAYIWHAGSFCGAVANSLEACRFKVRAHIVWVKPRQVFGRGDYHFQHEPCFYAVKEGAEEQWRFVPEHEIATYTVREGERGHYEGGRKQSTVWNIEHVKSETGHGTQKPVEAMKRPIENNSQPGEAIYEPFSGSGTTIIAAEMTGRRAHAIELNPLYVDVAVKRWQNFTGLLATLESDGRSFDDVAAARAAERRAAADTAAA